MGKKQQQPLIRSLWPEGMKSSGTDRGISEWLYLNELEEIKFLSGYQPYQFVKMIDVSKVICLCYYDLILNMETEMVPETSGNL
jgi:hypothetical protein